MWRVLLVAGLVACSRPLSQPEQIERDCDAGTGSALVCAERMVLEGNDCAFDAIVDYRRTEDMDALGTAIADC